MTGDGRPFFAMEYVAGVPITDYCDTRRLSNRERLKLFGEVCHGVQHAHQKGIIHRDLKPTNVLVSEQGQRPIPKIIDFGVAKAISQRLTEKTVFTRLGQWIGSPEYMSPEQAEMTGLDIDTRSDVYSLGVMLYELLAGTQPFDSTSLREAGFDEMRRKIREDEPPRPSTRVSSAAGNTEEAARRRQQDLTGLIKELKGDLDWIVMRALEKDRTRRYASPNELAADLDRHLLHQPVLACPPGTAYRVRKFIRRHRLGVIAAGLIAAALIGGLALATSGMVRARRAERLANTQVELLIDMLESMDPGGESGGNSSVESILAEVEARIERELSGRPLVRARIEATLAGTYFSLGLQQRALVLLERVLETRSQILGHGHAQVAVSLRRLGSLHGVMGTYDQAQQCLERALEIDRAVHGPGHRSTAETLNELAIVLWRRSDYEKAKTLFEQAMAIREPAYGPEHPEVGYTLYMQAVLLRDLGEYDRARDGFERALAIRERVFGEDHTAVAWVLSNYGALLVRTGEHQAARDLLERALAIQEQTFGPEHFTVTEPSVWLAEIDASDGDFDRARRRIERVLAIQEEKYGPDHHFLASTLRTLGSLAFRSGKLERALTLFERQMEILESAFGADHPRTGRARLDVAALRARSGDPTAGRALYRQGIETVVEDMEHGQSGLEREYYNLACIAALVGESGDAIGWLRRALDHGFKDAHIFTDADLDSLRGDPDFTAIVAETRLRQ